HRVIHYIPTRRSTDLDERKKITKLLKKNAEVLEAKPLNERDLKVWVRTQANANKIDMDEDAIELFVTLVGTDLMNLHSELTKLRSEEHTSELQSRENI